MSEGNTRLADDFRDCIDCLNSQEVTQFGVPPLRIDLLASISGVTFDAVLAGAETIASDGATLRVIGLKELFQNKRASGRAKDKDDLRRLRARAKR